MKKRQESKTPMLLYLDLRTGGGHTADSSWETVTPSRIGYTTRSIGESPSEGNASRLSQILQDGVPEKYYLSARAAAGILTRAKRRGKQLPEILQKALEKQAGQSASKNAQDARGGKGILIQDEHVGSMGTSNRQGVCYGFDPGATRDVGVAVYQGISKEPANGTCPGHHNGVAYGIDRSAYNQGQNAQYDMPIEEDLEPPIVARGGGAVCALATHGSEHTRPMTPPEQSPIADTKTGWNT